jgi:hypothetical protein
MQGSKMSDQSTIQNGPKLDFRVFAKSWVCVRTLPGLLYWKCHDLCAHFMGKISLTTRELITPHRTGNDVNVTHLTGELS